MKLSFISVTYQSRAHIEGLLKSVFASAAPGDEVFIVDNRSTDGTVEAVRGRHDARLHVIENDRNRGFGAAVNQAALRATGEKLVLVNPDSEWSGTSLHEWIATVEAEQKENPRPWVALGPWIRYADGRTQPSQGGFSTVLTFMLQFLRVGALLRRLGLARSLAAVWPKRLQPGPIRGFLGNFESSTPKASSPDWVSGAFLVVDKKAFLDIGGFDEEFFLYCEDDDLCRRLFTKGRMLFDPRFQVTHAVEGSRGHGAYSAAQAHRFVSNLRYTLKWNLMWAALTLWAFYTVALPLKSVLMLVIAGPDGFAAQWRYWFAIQKRGFFR